MPFKKIKKNYTDTDDYPEMYADKLYAEAVPKVLHEGISIAKGRVPEDVVEMRYNSFFEVIC